MNRAHTLTLLSPPGQGPMTAIYITIADLARQLTPEEKTALAHELQRHAEQPV